jgi:type IV pilus assembly protein PilW
MNPNHTHIMPAQPLNAKLRAKQTGLSLIELMVAMTISLFMLIAIGLVYSTSKSGFAYANNTVRMSEDASFALDSMSRDVRMAGYGGCAGVSRKPAVSGGAYNINTDILIPNLDQVKGLSITLAADKPNPFSASVFNALEDVRGFTNNAAAVTAAGSPLPSFLDTSSTSFAVSTTAPILFVSGGSDRALQVNAAVTGAVGTSTNIVFAGDPNNWNNNFAGSKKYFMLISDCKNSEIFRADSMSLTGTMTTADNKPLLKSYSADAVVTPLVSSTYFLASRKSGGVTASTPSLYRSYFNGNTQTTEELVPNVEAIAFQYGENTTCLGGAACSATNPPSYVADEYRLAADVTDWSRVVSVRMGLIMVTEDNGQTAKQSATTGTIPWINGNYAVPTADRRLRRAYSTTVTIRNRSAL